MVVDDLTSGSEANIHPEAKFFKDFDVTKDSFFKTKLKIDVIYHLAAISRINDCKARPDRAMDVNSGGTARMLEMAKVLGSRFVYAGSSCSYWPRYSNIYGYTKWLGEEHCRFYANCHGVSTLIARFFNVYGPRCPQDGPGSTVVGIFERQKAAGLPLTVTGDGRQRRDFIHVSDVVDGLLRLLDRSGCGEHFDFGTGINYEILEIARMFCPDKVEFLPDPVGEAKYTLCQDDRASRELGWEPKIRIADYIFAGVSDRQGA